NGLLFGHLSWAANVGFLGRRVAQSGLLPAESGNMVGSEVQLGASLAWMDLDQGWSVGPEALYATVVTSGTAFAKFSSSAEALMTAHYNIVPTVRAGLAAGFGMMHEPGTPKYRVLARLAYAPDLAEPLAKMEDKDADGIADERDACPEVYGIPSADPKAHGCPPDSDGDGVIDVRDACPGEPQGEHPDPQRVGCPAPPDQDKDGVPDAQDVCAAEPQGPHPDPARAGCPEGDKDRDGVLDSADACPDIPQVPYPDPAKSGCPLPDRDNDQVPDHLDACPDTPGMPNSDAAKNGCPGLLKFQGTQITTTEPVFFAVGKDVILSKSFPILQALANILKDHPGIKRLSVDGHTDNKGNPAKNLNLSQRRADSVMAFLIKAGVAPDRLEAHGYGDTKPVAPNTTEKDRAKNRRVEFKILEQE
ncbi:MAG TPA: OmpA family protein, partial [Myxococcota bacterium]|nr:OmpA family protein [Myxococcota bacterium]